MSSSGAVKSAAVARRGANRHFFYLGLFLVFCLWYKIGAGQSCPSTTKPTKGFLTMLDIATISGLAAEKAKAKGDSVWSVHHDVNDTSLFSKYARIRRVPVSVELPLDGGGASMPERLDGYDALYNEAMREVLDTRPIGKSYNLVPHDVLFATQADMLMSSDLPAGGNVEVCDRLFDGGLKAHRTVYFHDLKADIGRSDDVVRCRMDIFNSVDMSWAFQVFSGAYRDLCRNTQVFGGMKAYQQKKKHTRNLSPEALIGKAAMGLSMWDGQVETMQRWRNARLNEQQFSDILASTICGKTGASQDNGHGKPVNEKKLNYLLHRYREELPELGASMWAGYNALTHWSTHVDATWEDEDGKTRQTGRNGASLHNVRRQRSDAVRSVVESPVWKSFEGMAA